MDPRIVTAWSRLSVSYVSVEAVRVIFSLKDLVSDLVIFIEVISLRVCERLCLHNFLIIDKDLELPLFANSFEQLMQVPRHHTLLAGTVVGPGSVVLFFGLIIVTAERSPRPGDIAKSVVACEGRMRACWELEVVAQRVVKLWMANDLVCDFLGTLFFES